MALLNQLCRTAAETFKQDVMSIGFRDSLRSLQRLLGICDLSTFGLKEDVLQKQQGIFMAPLSTPVVYADIFKHQNFQMSMFVVLSSPHTDNCPTVKPLQSGRIFKALPLHNHPQMHGMLKVLFGSVYVQTYTPLKSVKLDEQHDHLLVQRHAPAKVNERTPASLLTPTDNNLHEIIVNSRDTPAVFIDILAPPYNDTYGRDCSYFEPIVTHQDSPTTLRADECILQAGQPPSWFQTWSTDLALDIDPAIASIS